MIFSPQKKAILAGTLGTVIQWYDFAIFGYFTPIIAEHYFPRHDAITAVLSTLLMFAVGYFLSPLGSLLFGYVGDRYGRKRALTYSIAAMALCTGLLSILPDYQAIGLAAPMLMTLLRMGQGFVASSEFSSSALFLVEHAPAGKKAFYGSLTSSAYSVGVLLAGLVAALCTASYMPAWGYRLGFAVAALASLVVLYLRRHVMEPAVYLEIPKNDKPKQPFLCAVRTVPYAVVGVMGLAWLIGVLTFGTYVFTVTYLHHYFDFSLSLVALIVTLGLAVDAVVEPFMAMLADKIGHVRVMRWGIGLIILLSFPLFYLLSSTVLSLVILSVVIMSLLIAITFSPINAYMVSLFPPACRHSGFGVSFHVGISLFGATSPLVMMALVDKTEYFVSPAIYYILAALVGLGSLALCEYGRLKQLSMQDKTQVVA